VRERFSVKSGRRVGKGRGIPLKVKTKRQKKAKRGNQAIVSRRNTKLLMRRRGCTYESGS